jgi:hypothetical protein
MSDVAMQALEQPELLSDVREEAQAVLQADPGFEHHPVLKDAVTRRLEQTSIS